MALQRPAHPFKKLKNKVKLLKDIKIKLLLNTISQEKN